MAGKTALAGRAKTPHFLSAGVWKPKRCRCRSMRCTFGAMTGSGSWIPRIGRQFRASEPKFRTSETGFRAFVKGRGLSGSQFSAEEDQFRASEPAFRSWESEFRASEGGFPARETARLPHGLWRVPLGACLPASPLQRWLRMKSTASDKFFATYAAPRPAASSL